MTSQEPIISFVGPSQTSNLYPSIGGFSGDAGISSDNNQGFYTYTKNSFNLNYTPTNYFWDQVSVSSPLLTRSIYDKSVKRWFTVELDNDGTANSNILMAVSNNMDYSRGSSFQLKIPVDTTGTYTAEYIYLSFNNTYIIVTVNLANISTSLLSSTGIFVFSKENLLNNVPNYTSFIENEYGLCPVLSYDSDSTIYFVYNKLNGINLASITMQSPNPIFNSLIATFNSIYTWNTVGGYAPQLHSATSISLGDDRIQNATIYNSNLWVTHSIFKPSVAQIMTWNIDIPSLTLVSNVIISKTDSYLSYPYIAVNKNNDVAVVFAEFNSNIYPSVSYSYKDHTDVSFRSITRLASGSSSYGNSSWGSYFSASVDSSDQQSFWLQGETTNNDNKWEVIISRIIPLTYIELPNYDFFDQGETQISTFNPSTSIWSFNNYFSYQFGEGGDKILPSKVFSSADDSLIVRSSDTFKIMPSLVQTFSTLLLEKGNSSDYPLSGDVFGSGTSLLILFNSGIWNIFDMYNSTNLTYEFGISGDIPLTGDWLNLKRKQIGVWRPSNGTFYFLDIVTGNQGGFQYGVPYPSIYGDVPVVGDYLGTGYDQLVIFRSFFGLWFIQDYLVPSNFASRQWGEYGDIPLEGKFSQNSNKMDIAVYRPSEQIFYILNLEALKYGNSGDIPVPGSSVYYRMKMLGLL